MVKLSNRMQVIRANRFDSSWRIFQCFLEEIWPPQMTLSQNSGLCWICWIERSRDTFGRDSMLNSSRNNHHGRLLASVWEFTEPSSRKQLRSPSGQSERKLGFWSALKRHLRNNGGTNYFSTIEHHICDFIYRRRFGNYCFLQFINHVRDYDRILSEN